MTLRLKSYFQGLSSADGTAWDDLFDSVPLLKSETADGASAVASYVDTSTAWSTSGAKLFSWRNNGTEKAYLDLGGKMVASSFQGDGSALTSLSGTAVGSGLVGVTYGGTGVDAHAAANGALLIGNGSGFALATLTAGTNVTITNGAGTIQIAASATAAAAGADGDYQYNLSGALTAASWKELGTNLVGLGGATSSFPAWKRSSDGFEARLADDSDSTTVLVSALLIGDSTIRADSPGVFAMGSTLSLSTLAIQAPSASAGVDTNTSGADFWLYAGLGTGNASGAFFKVFVPVPTSSGTSAQSYTPAFVVGWSAVAVTTTLLLNLGTLTASQLAIDSSVTWNDSGTSFTGWKLAVTNTASASSSLLADLTVGGTTLFSVRVDGLAYAKQIKYGTDGTGAGAPLFGTNCPAVTLTAPYKWLTMLSSDGSTVYVPAWK